LLRCETEQPVDDLLVGLSNFGFAFVQVKHRLRVEKSSNSAFAGTIDQFVRQYIDSNKSTDTDQRAEKPLSPDRDRLIAVTSPSSSEGIRDHLPRVLTRIRSMSVGANKPEIARSKDERNVLNVMLHHVQRSWNSQLGHDATESELHTFLCLLRFEVLDVDNGGTHEREAKDLLQSLVLATPNETSASWTFLVDLCSGFASKHSGADRKELSRFLQQAHIATKEPRSYTADIRKLKDYSSQIAKAVRHLSLIRSGNDELKIDRASTLALYKAAGDCATLVTGDPGTGKSAALYDFVQILENEKRDYVFLAVDRLSASSASQISSELGLDHGLDNILSNWPGTAPAFLVVDALDAARAELQERAIRDVITQVIVNEDRWHVVASVRRFDLRYNEQLKRLFRRPDSNPTDSEFVESEFRSLSHFRIPLWSSDEISRLLALSPQLAMLVQLISAKLRDLLRKPFNLRLLAELAAEGVTAIEMQAVHTELQLLDKYWSRRVLDPPGRAHAHELQLSVICEEMITLRTLRVKWNQLSGVRDPEALTRLLSNQVLDEWRPSELHAPDRSLIMFSHHVLFDYAVARLVLRGEVASLVERLAADSELAIVVRPSFSYHFQYLWALDPDHRAFWELSLLLASRDEVSEIAKSIAPATAIDLVRSKEDFNELCARMNASDGERATAEYLLHHLIGAALVVAPFDPSAAGPWCDLLDRISKSLKPRTAYSVNALLFASLEKFESLLPTEQTALGATARRVLEFAWAQVPRDGWLVIQGMRSVCKTFETEPSLSGALLREALVTEHVVAFGYEELSWLARGIKHIIDFDPDLVESVYSAAFLYQETSQDPTPLGPSRIFSMVSTKKQDFEMARYQLAEIYPIFLEKAPDHAMRAMLTALEGYLEHDRGSRSSLRGQIEQEFAFGDRIARFRPDSTFMLESGFHTPREEALKIVSTFFDKLELIASSPESSDKLQGMISLLVEKNRTAFVWRKLLELGARYPSNLGPKLAPLAEADPLLEAYDTSTAVGEYLRSVYPHLIVSERIRIEKKILSLSGSASTDKPRVSQSIRNRLLGCLPAEYIQTTEVTKLIDNLRSVNAVPNNAPPVQFDGAFTFDHPEFSYLADLGVPVNQEENKRIQNATEPISAFAMRHGNSTPSMQEVLDVMPLLIELEKILAATPNAHPLQLDHGWGYLSEGCERISRVLDLSCTRVPGAFVRKTLLAASEHKNPEAHSDQDKRFDEACSWGGPSARISAAQGVANLSRNRKCVTAEVLETLARLCGDPAPAVRFQIVVRLGSLYETDPELMWRLIEERSRLDQSRGVLSGLTDVLERLGQFDPDKVADILAVIYKRFDNQAKAKIRTSCLTALSSLYVGKDQQVGKAITLEAIAHLDSSDSLWAVASRLRTVFTLGPINPPDAKQDAIRQRGFYLMERILDSTISAIGEIQKNNSGVEFDSWTNEAKQEVRDFLKVVEHVAKEMYFASGAFHESQSVADANRSSLSPEAARRFYAEAQPILDRLTSQGYPAISHTLLETLEAFVEIDPPAVFLRITKVVREGRAGGYQYESMAADLVVRIVKRYLAEYRLIFRQHAACRAALVEVLDLFVKAGWPSARRLTYGLEAIFR
jgi:KaiC/GvpD/RAD55 family RecA-like ATPase